MKKENVDVLVIGAGPSGSVTAAYLNKHGINVKVVEKTKFPRFQIGESLIPRCMDNFKEAGLLECLMQQGYQKKKGARFIKNNVHGNFDFSKKHGDGWDWTWQVPRAHFDKTLIDEVIRQGVSVNFETEVTKVVFNGSNSVTTVRQANGTEQEIYAKFIIDSSGFGRVIARQLGLEAPPKIAKHGSIFTHVKDIRRPQGNEGTRITFEIIETNVWFWYIPFSDGTTSIGFVGPMQWIHQFKGNHTEVLQQMMKTSPYYNTQFEDLPYLFEPHKVENISKNVTKIYGDGFVLTGNSAEFLDPVFSSGVSFATESGLLAAKLVIKQLHNEEVDWQSDFVDYMKEGVHVFATYVKEWYTGNLQKIMLHDKPNKVFKEQICAVLAGYVWDKTNPFVRKHKHIIRNVAKMIEMEENMLK
ncbi:NAD(P)/FAD-dependent oxidoreductase [Aquimarina addita]|uniref:NAD(P)/FAD-dependent oxidoreductase n=1 Tax=Aquimarina addita TaxID=870485 RepID=A0ABP6UL83_9FLAO